MAEVCSLTIESGPGDGATEHCDTSVGMMSVNEHERQIPWQKPRGARFGTTVRFATRILAASLFAAVCTSCTSSDSPDDTKLLAPVVPATKSESLLNEMRERGTIRVGVKFDVPLFGLKDAATGKLSGFDIEIAKAIVNRIYPEAEDPLKHIQFIEAISKNREKFLQNHTVDLVVSTYTINAARKELVDFAGPYYIAGQDILTRNAEISSGRIRGVGDVNGKKVCSVTGSTSLNNLRVAAPKVDTSVTKDKYSECFESLKKGEVIAMSTDDVILLGLSQGSHRILAHRQPVPYRAVRYRRAEGR